MGYDSCTTCYSRLLLLSTRSGFRFFPAFSLNLWPQSASTSPLRGANLTYGAGRYPRQHDVLQSTRQRHLRDHSTSTFRLFAACKPLGLQTLNFPLFLKLFWAWEYKNYQTPTFSPKIWSKTGSSATRQNTPKTCLMRIFSCSFSGIKNLRFTTVFQSMEFSQFSAIIGGLFLDYV